MRTELLGHLKKQEGAGIARLTKNVTGGSNFRTLADVESLIDYTYVYEVKYKNGDANYTFGFNDPRSTKMEFFNIVLKKRGAYSKSVLIKYEMNAVFAANYLGGKADFDTFTGSITIEPLDTDAGIDCEEERAISIPVTGGNGPGSSGGSGGSGPGGGGGSGGNPYNQSVVDAKYLQLTMGAPVVAEDPNGDDSDNGEEEENTGFLGGIFWTKVHKSPRYFRTGGTDPLLVDPANPCAGQEEIGIIEPVPDPHEKNCEELKKLFQNSTLKNSFNDLKNNKLSDNKENGYSFTSNTNNIMTCTAIPTNPNSNFNSISIPVGGNIFGASHTHPDDGKGYPMFSAEDIYVLYKLQRHYNYNVVVPLSKMNAFVYTVTTAQGTYAIKIDTMQFYGEMRALEEDKKKLEDFFEGLTRIQNRRKTTDSSSLFQKDFLNYVKKYNLSISLYKANEDFTGWDELTIDPHDTNLIKTTNCN
ncbi:hypothetical protein [Flavobacterium sp.]|uniref:hypothetical protein n=1 Tax=Flavobacterium sp. TaxID=239 RepID=UPI00403418D8